MSFFDFFPTPKFLEMPAPGLAVSDSGFTFIEFGTGPTGTVVSRYGQSALPAGLIENGVVLDRVAFTHALKNFRKSFNLRYIRTTLPEERAYLYETKVPRVAAADMRTAVEATVEENVPIAVADAIFDFVELPAGGEKHDEVRVSVSVIASAVVEEFLSIFRDAGYMPLHFDVESQAVAKAVIPKGSTETILIVNMHGSKLGFSIVSAGAVGFTSTVPIAMNAAQATGDLKHFDEEIKKVFLYWQTEAHRRSEKVHQIERVIITGESAPDGIDSHIARTFDVRAELGNVWVNAFSLDTYVPPISLEESLGYASAIGLALSHK